MSSEMLKSEEWTIGKEDLLDIAWESHRCLYDVTSDYSNRVVKTRAWQDISAGMIVIISITDNSALICVFVRANSIN